MAEQAGMSVRGWSVGDESELLQIYRAGAAGTTVNWPDRALAILTDLYGDS